MSREVGSVLRDLFTEQRFTGFGPSRFHPVSNMPAGFVVRGRAVRILHEGVREHAPKTPGVYGMLDQRGRIIYVGKAKNLRNRLMCYFRPDSRDPKAGKIIQRTRTLLWEQAHNELAALLRELELIQRHRPRFNVIGLPGRQRYVYICLGRGPAAYLYVARDPSPRDLAAYGPFVGRARAEAAVRWLNDHFQLRNCSVHHPIHFADQKSLFTLDLAPDCLRQELGTCLGPCAGTCSRQAYTGATRRTRAFLDGFDKHMIESLRKQMLAASAAMEYERASTIRDKLAELEWLDLRLTLLRRSRDQVAYVYSLRHEDGPDVWYLLNRGQIVSAILPPQTEQERLLAADRIAEMISNPMIVPPSRCVDSVLLVSSWFRKHPDERNHLRLASDVLQELRPNDLTPPPRQSVPRSR